MRVENYTVSSEKVSRPSMTIQSLTFTSVIINQSQILTIAFSCSGRGRRKSAAVHQSHYSVGPGLAQEGPAGLACQSSKVRLH